MHHHGQVSGQTWLGLLSWWWWPNVCPFGPLHLTAAQRVGTPCKSDMINVEMPSSKLISITHRHRQWIFRNFLNMHQLIHGLTPHNYSSLISSTEPSILPPCQASTLKWLLYVFHSNLLTMVAAGAIRHRHLTNGGIRWLRVKPLICSIGWCAPRCTTASAWQSKLPAICLHFSLLSMCCCPLP